MDPVALPPMRTRRLVIAEDNILVRQGLMSLLGAMDGLDVVAAAASLPELLQACDAFQPDVVLTDIRMPPDHSDEGIRAANHLRRSAPDVGVVVLSQFLEPAYALALLEGGSRGRGYLLKDRVDDPARLQEAIATVARGGSYIDDQVADALVRGRQRMASASLDALTPRELEVLSEIATGATNAIIAERLVITETVVEKHCTAIFAKLGLAVDEVNRRVSAVLVYLAGQGA